MSGRPRYQEVKAAAADDGIQLRVPTIDDEDMHLRQRVFAIADQTAPSQPLISITLPLLSAKQAIDKLSAGSVEGKLCSRPSDFRISGADLAEAVSDERTSAVFVRECTG